jgi:hypothetical protein
MGKWENGGGGRDAGKPSLIWRVRLQGVLVWADTLTEWLND